MAKKYFDISMLVKIGKSHNGRYVSLIPKFADIYLSALKQGIKPKMEFRDWCREVLTNTSGMSKYSDCEAENLLFDNLSKIKTEYIVGSKEVTEILGCEQYDIELYHDPVKHVRLTISDSCELISAMYRIDEIREPLNHLEETIFQSIYSFGEVKYNKNGFVEPIFDEMFHEKLEVWRKEDVEAYGSQLSIIDKVAEAKSLVDVILSLDTKSPTYTITTTEKEYKKYVTPRERNEFIKSCNILDIQLLKKISPYKIEVTQEVIDFYNKEVWDYLQY